MGGIARLPVAIVTAFLLIASVSAQEPAASGRADTEARHRTGAAKQPGYSSCENSGEHRGPRRDD